MARPERATRATAVALRCQSSVAQAGLGRSSARFNPPSDRVWMRPVRARRVR